MHREPRGSHGLQQKSNILFVLVCSTANQIQLCYQSAGDVPESKNWADCIRHVTALSHQGDEALKGVNHLNLRSLKGQYQGDVIF